MSSKKASHYGIATTTSCQATSPLVSRLAAVPGLVVSTLLATLLLYTALTSWTTTGPLFRFTVQHRASTQVVVHILSWTAGAAQLFMLKRLTLARLNQRLWRKPVGIDNVQFWISVSSQGIDLELSWPLLGASLLYLAILSVPSLLWAGATTPVVTQATGSTIQILLADYPFAPTCTWAQTGWPQHQWDGIRTNQGSFGVSALYTNPGTIFSQIAAASSRNSSVQSHAKLDNTGYTYIGRSYGVGGSVGLATPSSALRFSYLENGYVTKAQCVANPSGEALLVQYWEASSSQLPNVFQAGGFVPNNPEYVYQSFSSISNEGNRSVFTFIGCTANGRSILSIVVGSDYAAFQNVQCEFFFESTQFLVEVDMSQKSIVVDPLEKSQKYDVDVCGNVTGFATLEAWELAAIQHPQFSILGTAFFSNVDNVAAQEGHMTPLNVSLPFGGTTEAILLRGVEEAFESLVDNTLLTISMAQLVVYNITTNASVSTTVAAVRLGQNAYIYALFGISMIILIVFLGELCYTRCWTALPDFNVANIKTAIIAASGGRHGIGRAAQNSSQDRIRLLHDEDDFVLSLGNKRVAGHSSSITRRISQFRPLSLPSPMSSSYEILLPSWSSSQHSTSGSKDRLLESH